MALFHLEDLLLERKWPEIDLDGVQRMSMMLHGSIWKRANHMSAQSAHKSFRWCQDCAYNCKSVLGLLWCCICCPLALVKLINQNVNKILEGIICLAYIIIVAMEIWVLALVYLLLPGNWVGKSRCWIQFTLVDLLYHACKFPTNLGGLLQRIFLVFNVRLNCFFGASLIMLEVLIGDAVEGDWSRWSTWAWWASLMDCHKEGNACAGLPRK